MIGDGLTNIIIDKSLTNENRLVFFAETNYDRKIMPIGIKYVFSIRKITGEGIIYLIYVSEGKKRQDYTESYTVHCNPSERAF